MGQLQKNLPFIKRKTMKTLLLILCSVFTIATYSCKENPTDNNSDDEIHEIGYLGDVESRSFPTTMKLGNTFKDTIPIYFSDGCLVRGYFKVNEVTSSLIECTLYQVRPKGVFPCTRGIVPSTAVLQFTPKHKGRNIIKITDILRTYTKEIIIE
jgi:hypothetical protein